MKRAGSPRGDPAHGLQDLGANKGRHQPDAGATFSPATDHPPRRRPVRHRAHAAADRAELEGFKQTSPNADGRGRLFFFCWDGRTETALSTSTDTVQRERELRVQGWQRLNGQVDPRGSPRRSKR